jgi:hypothetical protein
VQQNSNISKTAIVKHLFYGLSSQEKADVLADIMPVKAQPVNVQKKLTRKQSFKYTQKYYTNLFLNDNKFTKVFEKHS